MKMELNTHSASIIRWGKEHPEAVVLSADLGSSCEIKEFGQVLPDQYFSMGLTEQNMVGWAAGLAREGFLPYLHSFGVFLYRRVLDQLEMSVAYSNLPVTFVGFLPGIMTPGGVSHQMINDVGVLRAVPNMRIYSVGDATDIEGILPMAHEAGGPTFIRMLRKEVPRLFPADQPIEFNKARIVSQGTDVAIFSESICTEETMKAVKVLQDRGVSVQHLAVSTLKPFTDPQIAQALKKVRYGAISFENHTVMGGLGTNVAETIAQEGLGTRLVKLGLQDEYAHGASKTYLMKRYGLDGIALVRAVEQMIGKDLKIEEAEVEGARFEESTIV